MMRRQLAEIVGGVAGKLLMNSLLGIVISWNRPEFLRRTLESLFLQVEEIQAKIIVVDNGSDSGTLAVIEREERIAERVLLGANLGINRALEAALPDDVSLECQYVLISDADMDYRRGVAQVAGRAGTNLWVAQVFKSV